MASFDTKDPLGLEAAYHKKVSSADPKDPFGLETALKKKVDTAGSSSSSQSSTGELPSSITQTSQLPFELQSLQKAGNDNPAPFVDQADKEKETETQAQGFRQINPSQYRAAAKENGADAMERFAGEEETDTTTPVDLTQPHQPVRLLNKEEEKQYDKPVAVHLTDTSNDEAELEARQKAQDDAEAKQREQEEQQHPGSWSNALPELSATVGKIGADAGEFGANLLRNIASIAPGIPGFASKKDLSEDLYHTVPVYDDRGNWVDDRRELTDYGKMVDKGMNGDKLGSFIIGMDAYKTETDKYSQENPLPKTFLGNTTSGFIHIAPDLAAVALMPESSGGQAADILDVLVGAAKNPFSKLQAAKGFVSGYNKDGLSGAIEEGASGEASGMQMTLLGDFAGSVVSPKIAAAMTKTGLVKNGKLSAMGADMLADATVFGAQPIASNLIQGKPIDWNEVQSGIGTGLGFGAVKAFKTYDEHTNEEDKVKDIIKDKQAIAFKNFMDAAPEAVVQAYNSTDSPADLTAKAMDMAQKTMREPDINKKKEYAASSSILSKTAGVKATVETIMNDREGFIQAIEESQLPDDQKKQTIDKANQVFKEVEQQQTQAKVEDLSTQINTIQSIPEANDPVKNPDAVATLIDKVDERTDLQVELLDKAVESSEETSTNIEENEQGQVQEKNEAPAATAGTGVSADNEGKGILEGGFQFKSKEHGTLNIIPEAEGEYTVHFEDGSNLKGNPEEIKAFVPDFNETKIGSDELTSKLHGTDDPKEIARMYDDKRRELLDTGNKEGAIAAYGPRTNADNFGQHNDPNNITGSIRLNYFKNKNGGNPALDIQADEINRQYFNGNDVVQPNDIAEFMIRYPGGEKSYYTESGNAELKQIADRYQEVTGKKLSLKTAQKLAKEYSNVTEPEIRDIQEKLDTPADTEKVKRFIEDELAKPGLHDADEVLQKLSDELDRYVQDPDNVFNLFHDVYQGDILSEEEINSVRNEIEQAKTEQLSGNSNSEGSSDQTGGEAPVGEEGQGGQSQPELIPEDDIPFQRSAGEPIPKERIEAIQGLMKKVFPNVETVFHPTVEAFSEAAKSNGIDATDLPNAFVDKAGVINFNPDSIHADTQIHEYGHILSQWAKENAPALYNRMISFGRDAADIHKELLANGYKLSGNRLAEEAFVTMLGRHGEGKLNDVIKNSGTRGTVSKFINDLWTKFQRYLINKTGFDISKFKNIKDMPINEFLDTVNSKYLLSDTKISDIGTKEYSQVSEQKSDRPVKMEGETMADFARRIIDWTKEQKTGQKTIDFEKPKVEERPGYQFSETSIKNRKVAEERRARFLDEVESVNKRDFGTVWERGKQMVDNGQVDPKVLADNIINKPRPLTAEETAALTYDRMRLYNDHRITMDNINDAVQSNDAGAETEARARLAYIEERINTNDIASKQAGYEQGLGLAARRMIAAQDYSLANQIQLAMVSNGGKELPADVRAKMEDLSRRLNEAEKKLADYEANAGERAAKQSLARLKKEAELEQRQAKKQKKALTAEQLDKRIADRKQAIYDKLFKNKTATVIPIPYADRLIEIIPDVKELAKDYINKGYNSVESLVDKLHDDLKDHLEGLTKRDLRDALSGYGKTSKPNKDEIEAQLRELKSQMRLTSALEDAQSGQRPLKSGFTREKPSDEVRNLQKQVHDAMRENGIEVQRDPISEEDAWKTALESVKTRLKNQITDLNKQLETGTKPEKKGRIIYDQEANDLKAERDRLQKAIEETEGNKELTDQERVEILTKSTEKSIEEYKKRIDELKTTGKDSVAEEKAAKRDKLKDIVENNPELKALRERLAELQDEHAKIIDEAKPKRTPEEVALDAFKKRMANKIAELEEKIAKNDYSPKPKKEPIPLDDEGKALRAQVKKIQRKFDENREKLRLANRTTLEKRLDWAAKYRRFILLSNITTLAKLSAAGATRLITSPLEEVAGHALSLVPGIDKISSKAPREGGGLSIKAEAESLAKVLSRNSINEMVRTIREGKSELDERVDQKEKTFKEGGFFELPGQIHAALKTVPKQVEYHRSLQKRIEFALKNGYDITSPDVQTSLQVEAFKDQFPQLFTGKTVEMSALEYQAFQDGKRAIFMQDNFLSDEWTAMIKRWENKSQKGAVAATMARIFLPIIKIPTNFVAESSSLAFGAVKAVFALRNGIEKLTPDEADYVMRALKKQSVGAAFFALGYFLPNYVGGFYRQGEKRKKDGPEADDLVIMGEKVPHWLMHAPVFEVLQMGATVRRVHDQYAKNSRVSGADEAVTSTLAAGKGLFGQIPMFGEAADLTRGLETAESLKKFSANFVLGLVAPYDVQRLAKWMDEDSHGNVIKRKEKGFIQHLESGIPIVRSHELKRK